MYQSKVKWVKGSKKLAVINISIIIIFLVIGLGYSYWRDSLYINTVMSTGSLDTVFSSCEVVQGNCEKKNTKAPYVQIDENEKKLSVDIKDAYPGYSAVIKYTVTNNGDIPVYCQVTAAESSSITANITVLDEILEPRGGTGDGIVTIMVQDVKKKSNYELALQLDFVQYNEMK